LFTCPPASFSCIARDLDKGLDRFYSACVAAGPNKCALYEGSASKISARLEALFSKLKKRPIPVTLPEQGTDHPRSYGLVDYSAVRHMVFNYLYKPYSGNLSSVDLAANLAAVERGDGLPTWTSLAPLLPPIGCPACGLPKPPMLGDAQTAIMCTDGDPVVEGVPQLQAHYERLAVDSSFADLWENRLRCACVLISCSVSSKLY
jgi:hypothetical protein